MMRAQATFYEMMQHSGGDVTVFASRLQEKSGLISVFQSANDPFFRQ
jgi:hypothetical protein